MTTLTALSLAGPRCSPRTKAQECAAALPQDDVATSKVQVVPCQAPLLGAVAVASVQTGPGLRPSQAPKAAQATPEDPGARRTQRREPSWKAWAKSISRRVADSPPASFWFLCNGPDSWAMLNMEDDLPSFSSPVRDAGQDARLSPALGPADIATTVSDEQTGMVPAMDAESCQAPLASAYELGLSWLRGWKAHSSTCTPSGDGSSSSSSEPGADPPDPSGSAWLSSRGRPQMMSLPSAEASQEALGSRARPLSRKWFPQTWASTQGELCSPQAEAQTASAAAERSFLGRLQTRSGPHDSSSVDLRQAKGRREARRKSILGRGWFKKPNMKWCLDEAMQIMQTMRPRPPEWRMPRQEFDLADMMQAGARASDLSLYLAEMPPRFWIFAITLVFTVIYLVEALAELWIDVIVANCGLMAYCLLFPCVLTWPAFIDFLTRAVRHSKKVMALHQRTVQFRGVPPSLCTAEAMARFCQERHLATSSILIPEGAPTTKDGLCVEVSFETTDAMKRAFRDDALGPHLKVNGTWVRVRPKCGKNTANVEKWLVAIEYLQDSVPSRYWLGATLSCLVSMALAKHVRSLLIWVVQHLLLFLGDLGLVAVKIGAALSLLWLFFMGCHSLWEIQEAREELRNETRADRLSVEAPPGSAPPPQVEALARTRRGDPPAARSRSAPPARRRRS